MAVPARPRPGSPKSSVPGPGFHWRKHFIDALAVHSDTARAAEAAGVSLTRAFETLRADPDFSRAWQEALSEGYLHLEMEVVRRLREGDFMTADGLKYDFASAIRLLAVQRDSNASAAGRERDVTAAEVRASIDRKIEDIRRRLARQKAAAEGQPE